jgi:hypothetical protein
MYILCHTAATNDGAGGDCSVVSETPRQLLREVNCISILCGIFTLLLLLSWKQALPPLLAIRTASAGREASASGGFARHDLRFVQRQLLLPIPSAFLESAPPQLQNLDLRGRKTVRRSILVSGRQTISNKKNELARHESDKDFLSDSCRTYE